ncbi:hypothetical protein [Thiolapillus sp.]|uniref:hypothetical protein n=1 Tax=Thiolapillus sp. TaxID=2017437 RepID=UPI003AF76146
MAGSVGKKLASREEVETARSNANAAQAQVEAARAALKLLEAGPRKEDIAAAEAELKAAEAALQLARQNLAHTELHAPADGIIRTAFSNPAIWPAHSNQHSLWLSPTPCGCAPTCRKHGWAKSSRA